MNDRKSDWWIPRDWRFIPGWLFLTFVAPIFVLLTFSLLTSTAHGDKTFLWIAVAMGAVGVVFLFFARLPLYRQRKFFSIGPTGLPAPDRKLYWIAYGFIGVSIAIMSLLLLVLRT